MTGVSNKKSKAVISLEDASLIERKVIVDKKGFDKVAKKLSQKMITRVTALDKAFDNSSLNPESL